MELYILPAGQSGFQCRFHTDTPERITLAPALLSQRIKGTISTATTVHKAQTLGRHKWF